MAETPGLDAAKLHYDAPFCARMRKLEDEDALDNLMAQA